jgi:hypothetical protein
MRVFGQSISTEESCMTSPADSDPNNRWLTLIVFIWRLNAMKITTSREVDSLSTGSRFVPIRERFETICSRKIADRRQPAPGHSRLCFSRLFCRSHTITRFEYHSGYPSRGSALSNSCQQKILKRLAQRTEIVSGALIARRPIQ